jgi:hypothetical protein
MNHLIISNCIDLSLSEMNLVNGGNPIGDAFEWYYKTVGSFYRGIWDGLTGNEPVA